MDKIVRVHALELPICADEMENLPAKVFEEVVSVPSEQDGGDCLDDRDGQDEGSDLLIEIDRISILRREGVFDLSVQQCAIHHHCDYENDYPDQLNGIVETEGVEGRDDLKDGSEEEDGEVNGDAPSTQRTLVARAELVKGFGSSRLDLGPCQGNHYCSSDRLAEDDDEEDELVGRGVAF